jgi:hypothetical protein
VQLDAPLTDEATTPDSYALPLPRDFEITNGALETCDLQESATANVSLVLRPIAYPKTPSRWRRR